MPAGPENVNSHRFSRLAKKLRNKVYRSTYLASHVKIFLANQISALRGNLSQEEFGKFLGKPQSVVSRLQNPNYGKYTLQTLLDVAAKMDVALIVRFVDYPTFLKATDSFSDGAVRPESFTPDQVDHLAAMEKNETGASHLTRIIQLGNKQMAYSEIPQFRERQEGLASTLDSRASRQTLSQQLTKDLTHTIH